MSAEGTGLPQTSCPDTKVEIDTTIERASRGQAIKQEDDTPSNDLLATSGSTEEQDVKNHLILFAIDTVNSVNNRDFDQVRSMRHCVSKDFTADILDSSESIVTGWDDYVSHFENMTKLNPDVKWHIRQANATVDLVAGTAEVHVNVEQVGQPVGIRMAASSISIWRRPRNTTKKWYLKQRLLVKGVGPCFLD